MRSRTTRTGVALLLAILVTVSAAAAPEGRSESRDWLSRQINRIVLKITKFFVSQSLDDPYSMPPHP